jgi:hypothetical protein
MMARFSPVLVLGEAAASQEFDITFSDVNNPTYICCTWCVVSQINRKAWTFVTLSAYDIGARAAFKRFVWCRANLPPGWPLLVNGYTSYMDSTLCPSAFGGGQGQRYEPTGVVTYCSPIYESRAQQLDDSWLLSFPKNGVGSNK